MKIKESFFSFFLLIYLIFKFNTFRTKLMNERKQFELEKEKKSLEVERLKFEEYKKTFQLELQMER